eukprot:COSAG03_NODE_10718_length_633_cov_0.887640_1_plen_79_part_10
MLFKLASTQKKEVKDPLRDLMKQMGLKMGPDIMEETKTQDDAGGAKVSKWLGTGNHVEYRRYGRSWQYWHASVATRPTY